MDLLGDLTWINGEAGRRNALTLPVFRRKLKRRTHETRLHRWLRENP
jgi:hypothetical protein